MTTISAMQCGRCYSRADKGMEAAVTTDSTATEMALAGCGARTLNTNTITSGNIAREECDLELKQASIVTHDGSTP